HRHEDERRNEIVGILPEPAMLRRNEVPPDEGARDECGHHPPAESTGPGGEEHRWVKQSPACHLRTKDQLGDERDEGRYGGRERLLQPFGVHVRGLLPVRLPDLRFLTHALPLDSTTGECRDATGRGYQTLGGLG